MSSKAQNETVPRDQILAYRDPSATLQQSYRLYPTVSDYRAKTKGNGQAASKDQILAYRTPVTTEEFNAQLAAFRNSTRQMSQTLQGWTSPEDIAILQKSYADQAKWLANASQQLRAQNPYDLQLNQQLDATIDWISGIGTDLQDMQKYYGQWTNKGAYDRDMRSYTIATMDVDKARAEEAQLRQQISQLKEGGLKNLRQIGELTKQLGQKNWDITQATKYQTGVQKRQMYETLDLDSAQQEVEKLQGQLASLQKQLEKTVAEKKNPASTYAASSQLKNKDDARIADLKAQIKDVQTKITAREQDIAGTREYRDSMAYLKEKEANDQRLQELDMRQAARSIISMRKELQQLEEKRNAAMNIESGATSVENPMAEKEAVAALSQQIQQLQQQISDAEQDVRDANVLKKISALHKDSRYESWIQEGMKNKRDTVVALYDANKTPEDKGSVASPLIDAIGGGNAVAELGDRYSCMTQEEFETYCGLLGKGDAAGAKEYLRYIDETLRARQATFAYNSMAGVEKMLYWLPAGLESGVSGIGAWFSGEPQPVSTTQMVSGMVQKEAAETNPLLGYAYGAGQSIANMAPSILVSTATGNPLAGATFMGFNAGGNSYQDALRQGKTQTQAMGYGITSGLSEAGLSYMLSGIGKLSGSGNLTRNAMSKLNSISNVAARAAGKFGIAYAGELVEEELQLFLDPFYRKIFFNEDYDAPTASEIFETAFVTLLTTAAYEGNNTIKGEMDAETYRKLYEHKLDYLTADILNIDPDSELAQRMQKRLDEGQKITADQIRSLVQEYGSCLAKASPEALEAHTAYIEQQYAEAAKQDFAPDLSKYSGRQLESVKRAVESGVLNNTRMTHTMVDLISKLEADKGVAFRWMDNEKLKESGFALEGKIVNGVKTADSILLNVDSHKALNAVAGHEITHVLEGTEFYDSFRQLAVQLAKAKGEYDSRMADLKQLYKEGTDLEAELVADIVGDYIFTDELFIRSLQTGKPGLFRAVYDEIKYLRRMATAGSKEARTLIKAEKLFEKIYRQPGRASTETHYSFSSMSHTFFGNEDMSALDADYIDAVNRSDMETAQRMVDEFTKKAGFSTEHLYHGTPVFGFTTIDTSESDDSVSFFATNNPEVAQGYMPWYEDDASDRYHNEPRRIGKNIQKRAITNRSSIENVVKALNETFDNQYKNARAATDRETLDSFKLYHIPEMVDAAEELIKRNVPQKIKDLCRLVVEANEKDTFAAWADVAKRYKEFETTEIPYDPDDWSKDILWSRVVVDLQSISKMARTEPIWNDGAVIMKSALVDRYNTYLGGKSIGMYDFYGKHDNQMVIRGGGSNWKSIPLGKHDAAYRKWLAETRGAVLPEGREVRASTRDISEFAKHLGYRSVVFADIYDAGAYGERGVLSDVYSFFYPQEDLKSADPVTYDDDGNVIPLSQRFNPESKDIRRSLSKAGAQYAPRRGFNIPGEAVKLRREAETAGAAHNDLDQVVPESTPVAEVTAQHAPDQPAQPQQPKAQLPQKQQTADRPDQNVQPKEAHDEQPTQDLQPKEQNDDQPAEQPDEQHSQDLQHREQIDEQPTEDDKGTVIKRRALELYEEAKNMKKGTKVSNDLSYLLDHIEKTPDGYRQLRTALLNIKNSPMETVDHRSKIEVVARERMQWYYEKQAETARMPEKKDWNWKPQEQPDDQPDTDPQPDEHPTEEKKEPIEVGASVFAFDRGNVGVVQSYDAETGEYTVTFPNEKGQTVTRTLPADMVTEISTEQTGHAKSIEEQLTLRLRNSQQELEATELHRKESWDTKAAQIKAKEEKLASMKNQDTRAANSLKRSIESLKRRQADEDARYDKKLQEIQRRITGLKEELRRDYSRKNKLNAALERIDDRLARNEAALKEHYDGLIATAHAEVRKATENKGAVIKKRALELYEESKSMKKGVKVSNDLSYLLDHIEKTPEGYRQLREALLRIKDSPLETVDHESTIEAVIRERMQWYYEEQTRSAQELEEEYNQELQELRRKAEEERESARQRYNGTPRQVVQEQHRKLVSDVMGDTTQWKDKKWGLFYKVNTLLRNLMDVVRDDKGRPDHDRAQKIYDLLQGNYNTHEAELKLESRRLKKTFEDMHINKWESVYIQMLGEYRYNPSTELSSEILKDYYEANKKNIDLGKVNKAIVEARKLYDDLFLRVNMVLRQQGFKTMSYRQGYFPHFEKEKESRLAKLLNWKTVDTEIPTSIAGMTENFTPERTWQGFNKTRKGDTTDYNFLKGLDTYIHGALDWIYHIEDLQIRRAFENEIRYRHSPEGIRQKVDEIRNNPALDADSAQQLIDNVFAEAKNPLNNFVTDLRNSTNNLAGKKDAADRKMEEDTRRRAYATMTNISSRVSANMVVGSLSSALTNLIPITQSWAQVSPASSLVAAVNMIRNAYREDGLIEKSTFMTNRLIQEQSLNNTGWDKIGNIAGAAMNFFDHISTEIVWRSKYQENMKKGMTEDEAIADADQFAENVMAGRSRGNMPTIFNAKNPVAKIFTAFQLEVANQYGYMFKDLPREVGREHKAKLAWGYGKMFVGAYLFNSLLQTITGRAAAFDPIRLLTAFLGDLGFGPEDEDEDDGFKKATMNLAENVMKEMPFIGGLMGGGRIPISSALPYSDQGGVLEAIEAIYDDVSGMITDGDGKYANRFIKQMSNPLLYLLMPMGGGQLKKTLEGASMYIGKPVDGSYTNSGELRYEVDDDPWSVFQALLFGQYANKNAREYFDRGQKPLGVKAIQEFTSMGVSAKEYREYKTGLNKAAETRDDQGREKYLDADGSVYWYDRGAGKVYSAGGLLSSVPVHDLKEASSLAQQVEYISHLPLNDNQKNVLYRSVASDTNAYGYTKYYGTETVNGRKRRSTYYYDGRNGILYDGDYKQVDYGLMKDLELAPLPDMSDYDQYSGYEEFKFAQDNPYKYEFLQTNGVSWQQYTRQKEVYDWAWNNPKQETMAKAFGQDIPTYKSLYDDLQALKSTRDADGKVTVERKEKVQAYIADIDLPEIQKKILYKMEYPSWDEDNWEIAQYIVDLPGASTQEKKDILIALGFKVDSKGKITWD